MSRTPVDVRGCVAAPRPGLKPGDLGNWCFIVPAGTANSVYIEKTGETELVATLTSDWDEQLATEDCRL